MCRVCCRPQCWPGDWARHRAPCRGLVRQHSARSKLQEVHRYRYGCSSPGSGSQHAPQQAQRLGTVLAPLRAKPVLPSEAPTCRRPVDPPSPYGHALPACTCCCPPLTQSFSSPSTHPTGQNHFDLSYFAFEKLAHPVYGVMSIDYRPVDCDTGEPFPPPPAPGFVSSVVYSDQIQPGWNWYPYSAGYFRLQQNGEWAGWRAGAQWYGMCCIWQVALPIRAVA